MTELTWPSVETLPSPYLTLRASIRPQTVYWRDGQRLIFPFLFKYLTPASEGWFVLCMNEYFGNNQITRDESEYRKQKLP